MNGTEAYKRLHPTSGYDSARSSVVNVLAKPNIKKLISDRLDEMAMTKNEVLFRLSAIARASEFPFIRITDEGFCYFDFSDPEAEHYLFLIKKIKTKRTRRLEGKGENAETWEDEWIEVELHDAQAALNTLAKYHGMLTDKLDVTSAGEKININVIYDKKE